MTSNATTVEEYLAELPDDRRTAISTVRDEVRKHLQPGFEEGMQYGMIGYFVPHSIYPKGYHCDPKQALPFVHIGSQKNHMAVYLFCLYSDESRMAKFVEDYKATGKKLDMGKSCVRFRKLDNLALDVVAKAISEISVDGFVAQYESVLNRKR